MRAGRGLVSNDVDEAGGVFLSRRFPDDAVSYARIRSACVRALSCERPDAQEGSGIHSLVFVRPRDFSFEISNACPVKTVLFGDDEGAALSYIFRIRDIDARGCARWYCLVLLCADAHHLVNCRESVTRFASFSHLN